MEREGTEGSEGRWVRKEVSKGGGKGKRRGTEQRVLGKEGMSGKVLKETEVAFRLRELEEIEGLAFMLLVEDAVCILVNIHS